MNKEYVVVETFVYKYEAASPVEAEAMHQQARMDGVSHAHMIKEEVQTDEIEIYESQPT